MKSSGNAVRERGGEGRRGEEGREGGREEERERERERERGSSSSILFECVSVYRYYLHPLQAQEKLPSSTHLTTDTLQRLQTLSTLIVQQ